MRIAVDLDDTINHAAWGGQEYGDEALQKGAVETLRRWKKDGHYIIIHTARRMKTCEGDAAKAIAMHGPTTLQWLKDNGVPYDELWWNKPHADVFVDDKAIKHRVGGWEDTSKAVRDMMKRKKTTVWVNGCFDVLHIGHIKLLEHANKIGSIRLGLDSDTKIRADKGAGRPFNSFEVRREMLRALKFRIDDIMTYDTNAELEEHIRRYNPHILVVGEEHRGKVVGADYAWGIEYFPKYEDHSTTKILEAL